MYCTVCGQIHNSEACPCKLTYVIWGSERRPYCCPVCGGNGIKPLGFYNLTSGMWTSSGGTEECRSCTGTGVVWQ